MVAVAERPAEPVAAGAHLEELSIDLVDVGENVRVDPGELEGLAATIREHGVIQAVGAVGPDEAGRYSLVFGQRRLLASKLAGRSTIPAIVRTSADAGKPGATRSLEQLVENLERADLNPIDEARALQDVLEETKVNQVALANRLGRSAPWIANALALLRTDAKVQELVAGGKLTAAHARAIGGLEHVDQADLAAKAVDRKLSAHDLEREAQWAKQNAKGRAAERERQAKSAAVAIAALEKTAAKDATIAVHADRSLADAIRKAGWTNVRTDLGYVRLDSVAKAGECGCNTWSVGWNGDVTPACIDKDHIAARRKERDAEWARERKKADEQRKAEAAAQTRRAEGIGAFLAGVLDGPLARRLVLHALLDEVDESFIGRYVKDPNTRGIDADDLWMAILNVPDDKLALEIGQAAGERLVGWQASAAVLAAIDAAMPPAPAKSKPEKAATTNGLPRGTCPVCGGDVALRKGGLVREHGRPDKADDERVCPGAGEPAAAKA